MLQYEYNLALVLLEVRCFWEAEFAGSIPVAEIWRRHMSNDIHSSRVGPQDLYCSGCDSVLPQYDSVNHEANNFRCASCRDMDYVADLKDENKRLKDQIERFGNTSDPTAFDFNVLKRLDELEQIVRGEKADCGDTVVEENVNFLRDRSNVGQKKYGVTLDRDDLSPVEWVQHLREELADALNYATVVQRKMVDDE